MGQDGVVPYIVIVIKTVSIDFLEVLVDHVKWKLFGGFKNMKNTKIIVEEDELMWWWERAKEERENLSVSMMNPMIAQPSISKEIHKPNG